MASRIKSGLVPTGSVILVLLAVVCLLGCIGRQSSDGPAHSRVLPELSAAAVDVDTGDDEGTRTAPDASEAVQRYRKAAEQGVPEAQANLGYCCAFGQGVPQSDSAAADWYYKAGLAFLAQGRREEALNCYGRIVALDPNHSLADRLRAEIKGQQPGERGTAAAPN